jgi:hypothetical protein
LDEDFRECIEDAMAAWQRLKHDAGFDLQGVFRRRELIPFVLVPRHVAAKHGSAEALSMLKNLQQAHDAFVFGAPFARLSQAAFNRAYAATRSWSNGATSNPVTCLQIPTSRVIWRRRNVL